ncbi:hypothetical protein ES703_63389 [subsurface metagenome]
MVVSLYSYCRVRANQRTLATLYTNIRLPGGYVYSDVALLVLSGSAWELTIRRHLTYRQFVATKGYHLGCNLLYKIRGIIRNGWTHLYFARDLLRHFHLVYLFKGGIDGCVVHLHDFLALFAVGFLDCILDGFDGCIERDNIADFEKGGLHNYVDSRPQAKFLGECNRIDNVELELLFDNLLLYFLRQSVPDLVFSVHTGQQECSALAGR